MYSINNLFHLSAVALRSCESAGALFLLTRKKASITNRIMTSRNSKQALGVSCGNAAKGMTAQP